MARSTTLILRPADLSELGHRFLAVLLMRSGLGFSPVKTAEALKRGAFGLVLVIERKTACAKEKRKKVFDELESGLKFQARLDVEQLIRQEFEIRAYDTLRRRCNELADRLGAVSSDRECPEGVKEAVCTIIWAAGKAEVPEELAVVKGQLSKKFGKKFSLKAQNNEGGCVDERVSARLLFQNDPSPLLVEDYLATMTKQIEVQRQLGPAPSPFFSRAKRRRPAHYTDPPRPTTPAYSTPTHSTAAGKPGLLAADSPSLSTPPPSSCSSSSTARSLDDKRGFERYRLFAP